MNVAKIPMGKRAVLTALVDGVKVSYRQYNVTLVAGEHVELTPLDGGTDYEYDPEQLSITVEEA